MKYNITTKNNLRVLKGVVIYHVIWVLFFQYAIYQYGNGDGVFTLVFGIHYAISIFPTIFLHIEYYIRNRLDELEIDTGQDTIIINSEEAISFNHIEKIVLYMAPVWHRNTTIRYWPFENYRYAKLQFKNGNSYILTCLMAYDLDKVIERINGVPIEVKQRLWASPLLS